MEEVNVNSNSIFSAYLIVLVKGWYSKGFI